jgi:beta-xylosidase
MYIYCSHDITGQTGYSITNVYLMSSDDLVNWTDEGIPFSASNTSWAGLTYAPDTISRNGFYYLYYGNGGGSIGVARSTSPTGPFTDPLGHSLVSNSTPGTNITYVFDPAAFIDDDGQAYLYFGGGGPGNARVIKLNSDMISVSGSAVTDLKVNDFTVLENKVPQIYLNDGKGTFTKKAGALSGMEKATRPAMAVRGSRQLYPP